MDMTDKVVLVTGASQGIGLGIARCFADEGALVHITGTRPDPSHYEDDLSKFVYHRADLSMLDGQRALIEEISEVDVLVNNAGVSPVETKDKTQLDSDVFREVIETNLTGVMELSKGFYESLKRRNGCIVNIGSVASHRSLKNAPAYTASKTGLLGLTRVLADRWARDGIRVNMIAPGFIETRMTETFRESEDSERRLVAGIPMRRWGTPAEIGGAALFLVSPAAAYITGVSLAVDGGLMLGTVKISGSD